MKYSQIITSLLDNDFYKITMQNAVVKLFTNEIVKYAPKTRILVNMIGFNLPSYYNDVMEQVQHSSPYILDTNDKDQRIMVKCDLKPILKLAE